MTRHDLDESVHDSHALAAPPDDVDTGAHRWEGRAPHRWDGGNRSPLMSSDTGVRFLCGARRAGDAARIGGRIAARLSRSMRRTRRASRPREHSHGLVPRAARRAHGTHGTPRAHRTHRVHGTYRHRRVHAAYGAHGLTCRSRRRRCPSWNRSGRGCRCRRHRPGRRPGRRRWRGSQPARTAGGRRWHR